MSASKLQNHGIQEVESETKTQSQPTSAEAWTKTDKLKT